MVAEDRAERTSFLRGPRRAPFEQDFPRFPLDYPKVKYSNKWLISPDFSLYPGNPRCQIAVPTAFKGLDFCEKLTDFSKSHRFTSLPLRDAPPLEGARQPHRRAPLSTSRIAMFDYRKCERCKAEYRPARQDQSYCSSRCKRGAAYGRERFAASTKGARKRRLQAPNMAPGSR